MGLGLMRSRARELEVGWENRAMAAPTDCRAALSARAVSDSCSALLILSPCVGCLIGSEAAEASITSTDCLSCASIDRTGAVTCPELIVNWFWCLLNCWRRYLLGLTLFRTFRVHDFAGVGCVLINIKEAPIPCYRCLWLFLPRPKVPLIYPHIF